MRYSSLALLVACSMASSLAMAQKATITFEGKVSDQTCSVTVDGTEGDTKVTLPNVKVEDFAAGGAVGTTEFIVKVTGCAPPSPDEEKYALTFNSSNLTTNGALKNITNGAGNIAVQLVDGGQLIDLNKDDDRVIDLVLPANATEVSHPMEAQYIKENSAGDVTAGVVKASVEYTLSYL